MSKKKPEWRVIVDMLEKVDVELIWDPPWDPAEMASEYAKDVLGIW